MWETVLERREGFKLGGAQIDEAKLPIVGYRKLGEICAQKQNHAHLEYSSVFGQ